jgi:diguanylate cyclase (GGDEF)-like protein
LSDILENMEYNKIANYFDKKASILFMVLGNDGIIRQINSFAAKILGEHITGKAFQDIILDFHHSFKLDDAIKKTETSHLLSLQTQKGLTQTYTFHFCPSENDILVFGQMDVEEIESLSNSLVALNQELNNLMRELNVKNRELQLANEKILELTITDPLTKLANRRCFSERIEEMVSLANRKLAPLSLIMSDIDNFKIINDSFGHDAGDRVLQEYAALMKNLIRKEDLAIRFGGEEFIIILPETNIQQAYNLSERIRTSLSKKDILENGRIITASYGVSQLIKTECIADFINRADKALYQAKASGRNKTVLWNQSMI